MLLAFFCLILKLITFSKGNYFLMLLAASNSNSNSLLISHEQWTKRHEVFAYYVASFLVWQNNNVWLLISMLQCIITSHNTFFSSFSITLSGVCAYAVVQCTILATLSCLLLYSFSTNFPHFFHYTFASLSFPHILKRYD